ncbi:MAG: hypothetical protein ACLPT4_06000 [Verrucomicrobiia bacterium]
MTVNEADTCWVKEIMDEPSSRIYRPRQVYVGPREQHYVPIEKRNKQA